MWGALLSMGMEWSGLFRFFTCLDVLVTKERMALLFVAQLGFWCLRFGVKDDHLLIFHLLLFP